MKRTAYLETGILVNIKKKGTVRQLEIYEIYSHIIYTMFQLSSFTKLKRLYIADFKYMVFGNISSGGKMIERS